jgi:hypothetical protein
MRHDQPERLAGDGMPGPEWERRVDVVLLHSSAQASRASQMCVNMREGDMTESISPVTVDL